MSCTFVKKYIDKFVKNTPKATKISTPSLTKIKGTGYFMLKQKDVYSSN